MTDQEYTLLRDMLRDAIRKTQSELDGLKEELETLCEDREPSLRTLNVQVKVTTKNVEETDVVQRITWGLSKAISKNLQLAARKFKLGIVNVNYEEKREYRK